jgi:hypothetical protein
MLRSLLASLASLTALALLSTVGATQALAAETAPGYAPGATVTVQTPAYAPPPTYAPPPPPPAQVNAQANYGAQPPRYAPPSAQYGAPPPQEQRWGGGSNRYAANFEIARPGWSIDAMLGFGFNSIYDFGIGIRAGYTLPQHIYIGGEFGYFFGGTEGFYSYATYNLGPEVGYDIGLAAAPVLIRPYVGLGYDGVSISGIGCNNFCAQSTGGFALWGGAMGTYNFTRNWSAGVDLRLIIPTFNAYADGPGIVAFTLSALGGYKF